MNRMINVFQVLGKETVGTFEIALVRAGQHHPTTVTGIDIGEIEKTDGVVTMNLAILDIITACLPAKILTGTVERCYFLVCAGVDNQCPSVKTWLPICQFGDNGLRHRMPVKAWSDSSNEKPFEKPSPLRWIPDGSWFVGIDNGWSMAVWVLLKFLRGEYILEMEVSGKVK